MHTLQIMLKKKHEYIDYAMAIVIYALAHKCTM